MDLASSPIIARRPNQVITIDDHNDNDPVIVDQDDHAPQEMPRHGEARRYNKETANLVDNYFSSKGFEWKKLRGDGKERLYNRFVCKRNSKYVADLKKRQEKRLQASHQSDVSKKVKQLRRNEIDELDVAGNSDDDGQAFVEVDAETRKPTTDSLVHFQGRHNHQSVKDPIRKQRVDEQLSPETVKQIKEMLEHSTPERVRQQLLVQGVAVSKHALNAIVESLRGERLDLEQFLAGHEHVTMVQYKQDKTAGLMYTVVNVPLLNEVMAAANGNVRHIYVDGTRNVGPHGQQVVTIMARAPQGVVPILIITLPSHASRELWRYVTDVLHHYNIRPQFTHVDFEQAEIVAFENMLNAFGEKCRIMGCVFHFHQSLLRWLQQNKPQGSDANAIFAQMKPMLDNMVTATEMQMFNRLLSEFQVWCTRNKHAYFWEYFFSFWCQQ